MTRFFATAFVCVGCLTLCMNSAWAAEVPADSFLAQVRMHFSAWDLDGDSQLSADEIELGLHHPAYTGRAAAAIAALRRAVRADRSLAPLSLAAIEASLPYSSKADPRPPHYESLYAACYKKLSESPRALYASGKPRCETLAQGRLGDCFLLAGLGAVAHADPERLMSMIQPQADGRVLIRFGDGTELLMQPPTDAEIAIGASTRNDGTWAVTFEKAVGHVKLKQQKTDRHVAPLSIIGVGGRPNTVVAMITGHKTERLGCEDFQKGQLSEDERAARLEMIRERLVAARSEGKLIVGGTAAKGKQALVPGIYYNHSYAVLDYNRDTDSVSFWNPLSNGHTPKGPAGLQFGYKTSYGRFECPLTEAVMWFGSFSVETDLPPDPEA